MNINRIELSVFFFDKYITAYMKIFLYFRNSFAFQKNRSPYNIIIAIALVEFSKIFYSFIIYPQPHSITSITIAKYLYFYSAACPLLTHSSISETLNFQFFPILWAGIFFVAIQRRAVSRLMPRYLHISGME